MAAVRPHGCAGAARGGVRLAVDRRGSAARVQLRRGPAEPPGARGRGDWRGGGGGRAGCAHGRRRVGLAAAARGHRGGWARRIPPQAAAGALMEGGASGVRRAASLPTLLASCRRDSAIPASRRPRRTLPTREPLATETSADTERATAHGDGQGLARAAATARPQLTAAGAGPPPAVAPTQRLRRGQQAVDDMRDRARRLGLTGELGADWGLGGGASGGAYTAELLASAEGRAMLAWDIPRLKTALAWFEDFLAATGRTPFVPAVGPDAGVGAMWNRATLDAFAEFICRSPPKGRAAGEHVKADAIAGY
eukprot:979413-Prymnesium_polylepis.1